MDAQPRSERPPVGNAVGERVLEIAAQVVVGLHRDDVRAVGDEEQIVGGLQVMRAGVAAAGEEPDRLQAARIAGIEDRQAVAEHVTDVQMTAVHHDLHGVRASAGVAVGDVTNAAADALRRNRCVRGPACLLTEDQRAGHAGERREVFPARHRAHDAPGVTVKTYAAPASSLELSASLPLTPGAALSSPRAVAASVLPVRSRATELPNSSNASVLEPLR